MNQQILQSLGGVDFRQKSSYNEEVNILICNGNNNAKGSATLLSYFPGKFILIWLSIENHKKGKWNVMPQKLRNKYLESLSKCD